MDLHPKAGGGTGDLASPHCPYWCSLTTQRPHSPCRKSRSAIGNWLILRSQHSYLQPEKTISTNFKPALTHSALSSELTGKGHGSELLTGDGLWEETGARDSSRLNHCHSENFEPD